MKMKYEVICPIDGAQAANSGVPSSDDPSSGATAIILIAVTIGIMALAYDLFERQKYSVRKR